MTKLSEATVGERGKLNRAYAKVPTIKAKLRDIEVLRQIGPITQFRSSDIARFLRGDISAEELSSLRK